MRDRYDVVISGGGVAGLSAAALLGDAGFRVICADPAEPVTDPDAPGADLRTTALLQPARDLLARAGLWDRFGTAPTPLRVMRIVEAGADGTAPQVIRDFDSDDISDRPFGWNLPNWLLRREMLARISELEHVVFRPGVSVAALLCRDSEALVRLSDGTRLRADLVIAADGRTSFVRQAAGIGVKTRRYSQKALSFAVTHAAPHDGVSTEIHRSGGPFTLVPLPDHQGQPCSAVVWMEHGAEAQRLAALPEAEFEAAMTDRSCELWGPLKLASRRSVWPIVSQIAHRMSGTRVALVAEAAHVVPPIGAQGLNMSLEDLHVLMDLALKAPRGLGDETMLRVYHRRRHWEVAARVAGIDLLNRTSRAGSPAMRRVRALGLNAFYAVPPLRRNLMRLGLGARG
ncbi:MAG: UbiH/UbiF family hydroxylase [Pseudomonadota bacterium]